MILYLRLHNILAFQQKGIMPGGRGPKSQLLIDKMVCEDSKKRRTNLAMAWVDFKKAFDSVRHSWLLEVLQMYKFSPALITFLSASTKMWNTNLTANGNLMFISRVESFKKIVYLPYYSV